MRSKYNSIIRSKKTEFAEKIMNMFKCLRNYYMKNGLDQAAFAEKRICSIFVEVREVDFD